MARSNLPVDRHRVVQRGRIGIFRCQPVAVGVDGIAGLCGKERGIAPGGLCVSADQASAVAVEDSRIASLPLWNGALGLHAAEGIRQKGYAPLHGHLCPCPRKGASDVLQIQIRAEGCGVPLPQHCHDPFERFHLPTCHIFPSCPDFPIPSTSPRTFCCRGCRKSADRERCELSPAQGRSILFQVPRYPRALFIIQPKSEHGQWERTPHTY